MTNNKINTWLMASRPKTLMAAVAPVLIATAMAYGDGVYHFPSAILCLLGALLIQIGTNLANDYFDFKKGADTEERIGPQRVMQSGLVSEKGMRLAICLVFILAAFVSVFLIVRGGWPLAVITILSIICGILYTAGPKPLAYVGLGDIFVLIFFGPVAVAGTYYVQSFEMNAAVLWAGLAPGLISTALLTVNNLRDVVQDRKANKKTLAVRFGVGFAKQEYLFCLIMASFIPVIVYLITQDHRYSLLGCLTILLAMPAIYKVYTSTEGAVLNKVLAYTGKLLIIYSVLFSVGWIFWR